MWCGDMMLQQLPDDDFRPETFSWPSVREAWLVAGVGFLLLFGTACAYI